MKKRNVLLDVMRGIAGLAVPMLHLREGFMLPPSGWTETFCGHNYLAVEFYLLLMGFMFGQAYDRRWAEGMGTWDFLKRRLKRLHPLVISGVVLGGVVFALQSFGCAWFGKPYFSGGPEMTVWVFVSALLMVPAFGTSLLAPLNACSWTLYFQYLANILYALVIRRMNRASLAAASVLSAMLMAWFVFGGHGIAGWYSFEGGWGTNGHHFACGFVRLAFPTFFGLLLSRCGWRIRLPKAIATVLVTLGFVAVLYLPAGNVGLSLRSVWNGVYEMAVVLAILPLLLLVCAGSDSYGGRFAKVAALLGELSFPVYMSHFMFMPAHHFYVRSFSERLPFAGNCLVFAGEYLVILLAGFAVMKFWERVQKK